jgi:hypothetical protein
MRLAVFLVVALCSQSEFAAAQTRKVAGLELQYPFDFREDAKLSARAFEVAKAANPQTRSVQVFDAPAFVNVGGGSGSFHVVKTVLQGPLQETPEQIFARAMNSVTASGAKVLNQRYTLIPTKDYESGRFSFEAEQGSWRIGGEMILLLDRRGGVQWLVQYVFGRKRISSFVSPDLDGDRRHASNVLATVKVADP